MERYYFFDSNTNIGDRRQYSAADWSKVLSKFLENGIYNEGDYLNVTADGLGMAVTVGKGIAFLNGRMYENDEPLILNIDAAEATLDRIDLIVLRLDLSEQNRYIRCFVVKGAPDVVPVAPIPQDTTFIKEIALAEIRVTAAKSTIDQAQITDKRSTDFVDPFADGSRITSLENEAATYDWVKSFGIGIGIETTSDWNTITKSGFYKGSVNGPSGGGLTIYTGFHVENQSGFGYAYQNVSRNGKHYTRSKENGIWGNWQEVLTDSAPSWTNLTLQNGATGSTGRTPRYTKVGKKVTIEGEITGGLAAGTTIGTLPTGYRPPNTRVFKTALVTPTTNDGAVIYVDSNGSVVLYATASTSNQVSLMGIGFYVD